MKLMGVFSLGFLTVTTKSICSLSVEIRVPSSLHMSNNDKHECHFDQINFMFSTKQWWLCDQNMFEHLRGHSRLGERIVDSINMLLGSSNDKIRFSFFIFFFVCAVDCIYLLRSAGEVHICMKFLFSFSLFQFPVHFMHKIGSF